MNGLSPDLRNSISNSFISIGYKSECIKKEYYFTDFFAEEPLLRKIDMAIFGHEPFDYRSACLSISSLNDKNQIDEQAFQLRALGAPYNFIIRNGKSELYSNLGKSVKWVETVETKNLTRYINTNKKYLYPDEIIRQKSNFSQPKSQQLNLFIDSGILIALENEASKKLEYLITSILYKIEELNSTLNKPLDANNIFKTLFKFITAKLLSDRNIKTSPVINFERPLDVIEAIGNYYNTLNGNDHTLINSKILDLITSEVSSLIKLNNLSIDSLTYIYENTFVTPSRRKDFGIHSTPSYIADYLLSKLPIENLSSVDWNFFDPMCGHGILLIAAMRKMRPFLPKEWNGRQRHKFFIDHIFGTEIDSFSIEVAKMCLTLSDFPEANGWNLQHQNIFEGNLLVDKLKKTKIFIANPPFEYGFFFNKQIPKPSYLLQKVLPNLSDKSLIGIILPNPFLDSLDYRKDRDLLLNNYNIISITNLPENVFQYSSSETSIIIAEKTHAKRFTPVKYSEVYKVDLDNFKVNYQPSWSDEVEKNYFLKNNCELKVPFLKDLWDELSNYPKLDDFVDIKLGVQHEPSLVTPKKHFREKKIAGFAPAITSCEGLFQYYAEKTSYIPVDVKLRRKRAMGAWELNWREPKIIVPVARISGGPWKFAAAIDLKERYVTRNFYAIWSKKQGLDLKVLAALLNSPIAALYVFVHTHGKNIPERIYKNIPVPSKIFSSQLYIKELVDAYLDNLNKDNSLSYEILLNIDAEILKLYKLPPVLEFKLLKIFNGFPRPVPFEFIEYFPSNFESYIPLHIMISNRYKNSNFNKFIDHFPLLKNPDVIDYLKQLGP
jgi:type I restriction-modification system DNA methylase subunit